MSAAIHDSCFVNAHSRQVKARIPDSTGGFPGSLVPFDMPRWIGSVLQLSVRQVPL